MPAILSAVRPPFLWMSFEGRTIIREIIEARLPQWRNGSNASRILVIHAREDSDSPCASTGWGKTLAFYGPLLVQQNLQQYPRPNVPQPPAALVVTPLIELGNAHVSH